MKPFRCSNCNKLLGMIEGKAEIKCYKCKTMNYRKSTWEKWDEERTKETNQLKELNELIK